MKYIAYYRVSTKEQGRSGLGLSAQKEQVKRFIGGEDELIDEFKEVESGLNSNRHKLREAISECKRRGAKLIIAKLDRLSRNASFILTLKESGIDFISADMPEANSLTIGIMAVLAQDEAKRISERTKAALGEIKAKLDRGETHISKSGRVVKSLGNPSNITDEARDKAAEVLRNKAHNNENNKRAGAFIISLYESGMNFKQITEKLNNHGFKTSRDNNFSQMQTKRLFDRYYV